MDITAPMTLRSDVLIIPVTDLDEPTRRSIDCEDGDFAITRPQSRSTSTVVDEAAASLIEQFRTPRTIVEAVMLFSAARKFSAADVLDDAYRLVRQMLDQGFLLAQSGDEGPPPDEMRPHYVRGDRVGEATVLRLLQFVEDTEVYLAREPSVGACVLKIQRPGPHQSVTHFAGEARVLDALGGGVAPRLVSSGSVDGRSYLLMEHCRGVESEVAAHENRGTDAESLGRQLALLQRVARAYATLHERHVVHGDVHPRNVLVEGSGRVRLIDFGLGMVRSPGAAAVAHARGGVAFFHEPETARAALAAQPWPPVTESGEQYAVAALLYYLLTGLHYVDFSLGRDELMHEIANMPPVPLVQRGLPEWPALEHCLFRALSKDPAARFATTAAMADALDEVVVPPTAGRAMSKAERLQPALASLGTAADQMLAATALDQPWFTTGLPLGPTASINYGAAGVAYVLGRVARARQDPALLARAEAWAYRAARLAATDPAAFVNPGGEITPASVGAVSPYHTHSGVAAVGALLADMGGDAEWHTRAVADFLSRAGGPVSNLDLTLGLSSTIVGACQLLRTVPEGNNPLRRELTAFCAERVGRLWTELDQKPRIAESDIDNLGMAHGWAGFIYATLLWSELTHSPLPGGLRARLDQLAELAEPSARGLTWPWALVKGSEANYMSGWCNGSAGHAHLWATATRVMDEPRFTELAIGAAWDAWDAPDTSATLCCGLAGRAYALLAIYRLTGDTAWLDRAKELAARAPHGEFEHEYPHSLYKGQLAIPVLSADLDDPEHAAQPFFELD